MVCFAEMMRAVAPLPECFADVLEVADDIVEDEVPGAVEDIVDQLKVLRVREKPKDKLR